MARTITPAPPDHPPPVDEPPYARPDDHSAISLREPPSPSGPDVMETAAGRRAVREVARVLDDETVRERWLRDCKGPVETVDAARVMLQSCGARLTSTEADAAVALGVIDGEFCGRRLARRCMAAADRVRTVASRAGPSPGQLKFEILRTNPEKNRNERKILGAVSPGVLLRDHRTKKLLTF